MVTRQSPGLRLIVEGGGDREDLKIECRKAFTQLLERAGMKGRMPRPIAAGGRKNAYDKFVVALEDGGPMPLLLVDSEAQVTAQSPWEHVKRRPGDGWRMPDGATDDHLHLMVQCMEAWFLADRAALKAFFRDGFNDNALPPATAAIESVAKNDLYTALGNATRHTKTQGKYGKGEHSFKLLATLDPNKVRDASPWANRFFATLDGLSADASRSPQQPAPPARHGRQKPR